MTPKESLLHIYQVLADEYGPQGWWPVSITCGNQSRFCNSRGYHPGNFDIPTTNAQKLEIALGAILTQNTSWQNAAAALSSLAKSDLFSIRRLQKAEIEQIALAIRSAGYYNQKSRTIKNLVQFLQRTSFEKLAHAGLRTTRSRLLQIKGIGPETADCILLYALKLPSFVIDAYTRRIVAGLGIVSESIGYDDLKMLFESSLDCDIAIYQEYHALLVRHGKTWYSRKPHGKGDEILRPPLISGKPEKNNSN